MKRVWPWVLIVILIGFGIMVMFVGFMYDVLFAGIPYQDPTPELVARYSFHSQVASIIRWMGACTCLIGCGVMIMLGVIGKLRGMRWQASGNAKERWKDRW
jgi:hypothetical protein